MSFVYDPAVLWLALAVQALGVTSAVLARLGQNTRYQAALQSAFFALLGILGGATVLVFDMGPDIFVPPGLALALMVLIAVWDFGPSRRTDPVGYH